MKINRDRFNYFYKRGNLKLIKLKDDKFLYIPTIKGFVKHILLAMWYIVIIIPTILLHGLTGMIESLMELPQYIKRKIIANLKSSTPCIISVYDKEIEKSLQ